MSTDIVAPQQFSNVAEQLNRQCFCITADRAALHQQLCADEHDADLYRELLASRPHLFADTSVFVSREHIAQMQTLIHTIEQVVAMPAYQQHVLDWASATAQHGFGPRGVCMGYDFHLGPTGPQLIEINTNAGGAWLNAALVRAQKSCCKEMDQALAAQQPAIPVEEQLLAMFQQEWALQRGDATLQTVAIIDDAPTQQYLYPEFRLAARMFRSHGINALILDPTSLTFADSALWHDGTRIDLVYNRLTDFVLAQPEHDALRQAYESSAVVATPDPHAYALYADKRNLTVLTDEALLTQWGVDKSLITTLLSGIPRTINVSADNADALWQRRRELFFKPASGYGGKATYRGDKLTTRVWAEILQGIYVAQERVAPSERGVLVDGKPSALKLDLRNYVYAGHIQLVAARLYQGQTTNFRTPGGGFAPVFI
ncbi:MAG: hypothetical protein ACK4SX_02370 [Alcanivoracaceae bacterium]